MTLLDWYSPETIHLLLGLSVLLVMVAGLLVSRRLRRLAVRQEDLDRRVDELEEARSGFEREGAQHRDEDLVEVLEGLLELSTALKDEPQSSANEQKVAASARKEAS